jgi:indolepyruvate ferredoxin oxidoreductase
MQTPLKMLKAFKWLRGTPFDLFGYSGERRMERALIKQYEADMKDILPKVTSGTLDIAVALASLPLDIRGFGPVKAANEVKAAKRREELLAAFRQGGPDMARAAE